MLKFPHVRILSLEASRIAINEKISLPLLDSLELLKNSDFRFEKNLLKNLKNLVIDDCKYLKFQLGEMAIESVSIYNTDSKSEGLILLENLLTSKLWSDHEKTYVKLATLYVPWKDDEK